MTIIVAQTMAGEGHAIRAAATLHSGELALDQVLVDQRGHRWRVAGFAFTCNPEQYARGARGLSLVPLDGGAVLEEGDELRAE